MRVTPARGNALIALNSIVLLLGVGIVVVAIKIGVETSEALERLGTSVTVNGIGAATGVAMSATVALPLIIPSILGIIGGVKRNVYGLHVAFLVLVIIALIWLFITAIVSFVAVAGYGLALGYYGGSLDDLINNLYVMSLVSGIFTLIGWCLQLAASIISCCCLCDKSGGPGGPGMASVTVGTNHGYAAKPY